MNNKKLTPVLMSVAAFSAMASIILVGSNYFYGRQLGGLRNQAMFINNSRPMLNSLAGELVEYSKRNPSLDPILFSTGVKQSTAPAAKPATK